jgi:hypothetical protein
VLADEDEEQEMDRWYSHTPWGQEFAQILAQWLWNVRLELGQQLTPAELRTTEFAPVHEAEAPSTDEPKPVESPAPVVMYGAPQWARPSFTQASLVLHSLRNLTARCVVQPITRSIPKNGAPSVMAPYESCMPRALIIAVPAPYARSARRVTPR